MSKQKTNPPKKKQSVATNIDDLKGRMFSGSGPIGLPPIYSNETDKNGRIYSKLFYNTVDKNKLNEKYYRFKIEVGFPVMSNTSKLSKILENKEVQAALAIKNREEGEKALKEAMDKVTAPNETTTQPLGFVFSEKRGNNDAKKIYNEIVTTLLALSKPGVTGKAFYGDGHIEIMGSDETNISESASNEIGDSFLKSFLDKSSEIARELNFASPGLNVFNAARVMMSEFGMAQTAINGLESVMEKGGNILSNMIGADTVKTLLQGNQLIYPKTWKSSSFNKKVNIGVRLYSPYGDTDSIVNYVIIPFLRILAFSLPILDSVSTVSHPFIIKVTSAGKIDIEMGIVTDITIKRGGKFDAWSANGMPRGLDLNIEISDLRDVLAVRKSEPNSKIFDSYYSNLVPNTIAENLKDLHPFKGIAGIIQSMKNIGTSTKVSTQFLGELTDF